jgi:peptidyl-prolyl cis-trans isomerase C
LKSKKTRVVATVLAGSMLFGAGLLAQVNPGGAGAPPAAAEQPKVDPNKVVLTVGESKMTAAEFDAFLQELPPEVQMMAKGPQKRRIGEDVLKLKLLAGEAKRQKLDETAKFKQQMEMMRDNALAGAIFKELQNKLVTDQDVQKYYDDKKGDFEKVTARHILIMPGEDGVADEPAAKAKADALKKQLDGGADFAALAKANSADKGSKENGGQLDPFRRGEMVPEFDAKAFELKPNAISEPVKSKFGYHIIQTLKKDTPPLEEVKEDIIDQLRPVKLEQFLADLKGKNNATLDEAYFGAAQPPAQPGTPATAGGQGDQKPLER